MDAGVAEGGVVGSDYDPMLAKVIVWGRDRAEALRLLDAALGETVLLGWAPTSASCARCSPTPTCAPGASTPGSSAAGSTSWPWPTCRRTSSRPRPCTRWPSWSRSGPVVDPFDVPGGWRVGAPAWTTWRMAVAGRDPVEVRARGRAAEAVVEVRALGGPAPDRSRGRTQQQPGARAAGLPEGDTAATGLRQGDTAATGLQQG